MVLERSPAKDASEDEELIPSTSAPPEGEVGLPKISDFLLTTRGPVNEAKVKAYRDMLTKILAKRQRSKKDAEWVDDYAKNVVLLTLKVEPSSGTGDSINNETTFMLPGRLNCRGNAAQANQTEGERPSSEVAESVQFVGGEARSGRPSQAVPPIKLNELALPPPKFDGKKPLPRKWLDDFEKSASANTWSDRQMVHYLPAFLTDAAHDWYLTLGQKKVEEGGGWPSIRAYFVRSFIGESDKVSIRREIGTTFQGENESVTTFMPKLLRLMQIGYPEKREDELVDAIKEKLRSNYQDRLALTPIFTLEELNDYCRKIEVAQRACKDAAKREGGALKRPEVKEVKPDGDNRHGRKLGPPGSKAKFENAKRQGRSKMADLICFKCSKRGHIAPNCRSAPKEVATHDSAKPNRGKSNSVNVVQPGDESTPNSILEVRSRPVGKPFVPPYGHLNAIFPANAVPGGGKLLTQKLLVNRSEVQAVVDTGAFVSVVDTGLASQCGWPVQRSDHQLIQAAGDKLQCVGDIQAEVKLRLGKQTRSASHQVLVVTSLCAPMIMGIGLIRALNVTIDLNAEPPLKFGKFKGVRAAGAVRIPPRSLMVVEGEVSTTESEIAISSFGIDNNLMVANAVCAVVESKVPMLVLNTDNQALDVMQGVQLASFEAVSREDDLKQEAEAINHVIRIEGSEEAVIVGAQLTKRQRDTLAALLRKHSKAFTRAGEIGCATAVEHHIEVEPGTKPFAEPMRRHPQVHVDEAKRQVQSMLSKGIIEESNSPWASEYVIVRKKSGDYRLCVDYRKLNSVTKKNSFPLPNIESCLEALGGKRFFSQLDFASGYWQVPVAKESRELTAFRTPEGLYQFRRMPFGLCNAPATFQKLINGLVAGLTGLSLQTFLDDVCIATSTWDEHLALLEKVFTLIIQANLTLKASKCSFGMEQVTFLGHLISAKGVQQDPAKTRAILNLPAPADVSATRRVLGAFSYYRKFIRNFAMLAEPLTKLTRKNQHFRWTDVEQKALDALKKALAENVNLHFFNATDPIMVKCDACYAGVAGILLQQQNGEWRMISCCSRRLSKAETNYSVTDIEGLAVVYTVTKFRQFLLGRRFSIITDHCALCALNKKLPESKRLQRWALVLSEFDFCIKYVNGSLHRDVDCLSRAPVDDPVDPYLDRILAVAIPVDSQSWPQKFESEEDKECVRKAMAGEEDFKFENDIVYKAHRLYVPTRERNRFVKESHESITALHDGVEATLGRMEHLWWPNMAKDVSKFISCCDPCQRRKAERSSPGGQMFPHAAMGPMDVLAIDYMGPLAETLHRKRYIALAIDTFTRFIDAKAMESQDADEFMLFLLEICGRYGSPNVLLTDNAKAFDNSGVRGLCHKLNIKKTFCAPYHSRGNAVAERALQSLQEKIAFIVNDKELGLDWELAIPIAVKSLNSRVHKSTRFAPFQLMFGRMPAPVQQSVEAPVTPQDLHNKVVQKQMENDLGVFWRKGGEISQSDLHNSVQRPLICRN